MIDIKFRAWNLDEKEIVVCDWEDQFEVDDFRRLFAEKSNLVMQYTGLKDKNGKEIYEGDVLLISKATDSPFKGDVFFSYGGFRLKAYWMLDREIHPELSTYTESKVSEAEIIGNIYENPELIANDTSAQEGG